MIDDKNTMKTYLKHINFVMGNYDEIPLFSLFVFRISRETVEINQMTVDDYYNQRNEKKEGSDCLSNGTLWVTEQKQIGEILKERGEAVLLYENPHLGHEIHVSNFEYVIEGFEDVDLEFFERIYRRLKNIPWDILETERLFVRESTLEDLDAFYRIYKDPSITRYMENLFENPEKEKEYLEAYIKNCYRFYETGIYTVVLKETGEIIGRAGLDRKDDCEELELGFMIGVAYQRKGYATEVCKALLQYAREYFPEDNLRAVADPENLVSVHLLEKLGFRKEGEIFRLYPRTL